MVLGSWFSQVTISSQHGFLFWLGMRLIEVSQYSWVPILCFLENFIFFGNVLVTIFFFGPLTQTDQYMGIGHGFKNQTDQRTEMSCGF